MNRVSTVSVWVAVLALGCSSEAGSGGEGVVNAAAGSSSASGAPGGSGTAPLGSGMPNQAGNGTPVNNGGDATSPVGDGTTAGPAPVDTAGAGNPMTDNGVTDPLTGGGAGDNATGDTTTNDDGTGNSGDDTSGNTATGDDAIGDDTTGDQADDTVTDDGTDTTMDDIIVDEGDDDIEQPSLVVSAQNNFWNEGEVAVVDSGSPNFTVNTGSTHQEWLGWGGTFNERGWDALSVLSPDDRQRAIDLLFDEADGMGLDWGRIPMGPSDYALARYTLSSGPGDFSITHDQTTLIPYIKAAQGVKDDVIYWGSPWTPPPWAKTGNTENEGYDKGFFDPQHYQAYADYFVAWIQAYESEGIPIDAVMPQNEPGWAQSYPTCAFGPARDSTQGLDLTGEVTLGTFVDEYLFPSIDAASLQTKVWFGTLSNDSVFDSYWDDMRGKPSADRLVGIALQWETQARAEDLTDAGYIVMQSEHKCGNYPWGKGQEIPAHVTHQENQSENDVAPNDFNYGWESWDLMRSWIEDGVHIYSAWNMVLDTHGTNLDAVRVWNQNSLLVVNRDTQQLVLTPYYYVFRHLAEFVDVGAVRVDIDGDALAFENPDGSVVAVMRTQSAGTQIVSINGMLLQFEAAGDGWVTVNWEG